LTKSPTLPFRGLRETCGTGETFETETGEQAGQAGLVGGGQVQAGEAAGVKPGLDGWVGAAGRRVATAEGSQKWQGGRLRQKRHFQGRDGQPFFRFLACRRGLGGPVC